jgi:hypothetical protein
MKRPVLHIMVCIQCLVFFIVGCHQQVSETSVPGWKAGVARTVITPQQSMWMAGYAARDHASEGAIHNLWAKALALEDSLGSRALLVTADVLGFPKEISDRIREQLHLKLDLSKSQIILSASHTHSGPVLSNALQDIYPLDAVEKEKIQKYSSFFETQIVELAVEAFRKMEPVRISVENGVSRFQVNRRNNNDRTLVQQTELKGPNDFAVPVLKAVNQSGGIKAVVFGYACHPTTLDGYYWCGDYPGFAQIELEKKYPGTVVLFFMGAGADQNPLPRRSIPLAKQYGQTLAASVERVLDEPMRLLPATLETAYAEINLPFSPAPSVAELEKTLAESKSAPAYYRRWAERFIAGCNNGISPITSYPYPIQVWNMGGLPVMSLGGELVVEYSIGLKKMFGHDIFVMGYCNDVMAYIPSVTILNEGGYEGDTSQQVYGLHSKWMPEIEPLIYEGMEKLASQVDVMKK